MKYFEFKNDSLHCEDIDVNQIAAEVGTPTWIYSSAALDDHNQQLEKALAPIDHLICYSVKANSNIAILRMFANQGCGFDIVSSGELYRVKQARADLSKVVFAGVSKTEAEVREAIESDRGFRTEA